MEEELFVNISARSKTISFKTRRKQGAFNRRTNTRGQTLRSSGLKPAAWTFYISRLRSEVGGAGGFACQPAPDHGQSAAEVTRPAVTGIPSSIAWVIRSNSLLLRT